MVRINPTQFKKRFKLVMLWLARACGLFDMARWLTRRGLMIIGWHGVSLSDEHCRFSSLFISPEAFRRRLEFLARHYRVIDLDEAMRQHRAGRFEPGQVVLTFDDGYYNFAAVAAVILQSYQMPATVYVVSADMESQQPVANLLVRDAVLSTRVSHARLSLPGPGTQLSLATERDRARVVRAVLDSLQTLPHEPPVRSQRAIQVARELEVDGDDLLERRVWHSVNCGEARALAESGFSIQLHTHNHLEVVDYPDTVCEQAQRCRAIVERVTQQPAVHYCYPTGLWTREAWEPLRQAGVESAVTTRLGPNFPQTPSLALRRFLDGEDRTQLEFEFEMSNLRWLLYAILHPRRWCEADEKRVRNKLDGKLF